MREINGGVVRAINQENHPCVPPSAPPPTPTPNTTQSPGVEWRELARPGLHIYIHYIGEALLSPSVTWLHSASVSLFMAPSLSFPLCFENSHRYDEKECNDNVYS